VETVGVLASACSIARFVESSRASLGLESPQRSPAALSALLPQPANACRRWGR